MSVAKLAIGVDVGGTFTDLFFLDDATGRCWVGKTPSTRGREDEGFLAGLTAGAPHLDAVATIVHGTTVATNALLERKGAPAGLITTAGFRDVLEMRRRDRPHTWGLWGTFEPVIDRDRRLEVNERVLADGSNRQPVDPAEVRAQALRLVEDGVEAIAIAFVNAYANPANERAALDAVREIWPGGPVSISSEILPEIREFERISTTALNACLQPVVGAYLDRLEEGLGAGGFAGQMLIVQSNGGVMTVETAKARPVRTALSGPAAGVIAASHIAEAAGFPNVVTGDVGGTSFDVSLIAGGVVATADQTSIDFGLVIRTPMVEIATIGAGGGSIAAVDRSGLLDVGPQSAGADPGPACYGRGNDRPTLTDANVLLGRIDPARPIGGSLRALDVSAARRALEVHVAMPLGLSPEEAAAAVIRVAISRMAGAIRLVSIERGHNPRDFALMPFGGGGALHACALVREIGLAAALVPRFPGVTSAIGCLIADMRHDFIATLNRPQDDLDLDDLEQRVAAMRAEGEALLDRSAMRFDRRDCDVTLDMLYAGQTHAVSVPVPRGGDRDALRSAFETRYRDAFGRALSGIAVRVLRLHVAVVGRRPKLDLAAFAPEGGSLATAARGYREVYLEGAWHRTAIYDRAGLPVGAVVAGPAILEQPDATILIEPGFAATIDRFGNAILRRWETT